MHLDEGLHSQGKNGVCFLQEASEPLQGEGEGAAPPKKEQDRGVQLCWEPRGRAGPWCGVLPRNAESRAAPALSIPPAAWGETERSKAQGAALLHPCALLWDRGREQDGGKHLHSRSLSCCPGRGLSSPFTAPSTLGRLLLCSLGAEPGEAPAQDSDTQLFQNFPPGVSSSLSRAVYFEFYLD